ncbi:MAG TPA: trypsin-like peptidase domain-containing protein [Kiritimatiellia bacterium]|nr:trypsin-like peptidase domain-containing protein [Kiritimatiellia bacterium]HRZ11645.1 trypsin-like peptidase domain-containing protein [Kiritimatiellia bacterium]HSA16804.1 trypsin-like peptidase domain-containing protein [Kiritimatiellia bacterium]
MKRIGLAAVCGWFWAWTALAAGPSAARQFGAEVADAVERVMPAVVVVRTEATVYHPARDMFFGTLYGIPERLAGQGSGVIVRPDGYVLTSHHVIAGAEQVEVVLDDGTKYPADLVGRDPLTDLAVLKIKAPAETKFTAIEPGDSDALRVGEFVIAVGSPFSLDSSVTLGIVSQKGRSVGRLPYEDFIQTDASINPGNSGGPLVDVDGRMVGINAMIQTGGPMVQGSIGIGFAVPVNLAMRVAEQLIERGEVERPWIGIQMGEVDDSPLARRSVRREAGVRVLEVFNNTPASRVGMAEGDLIIKVNGVAVATPRAVQREIFKRRAGETITLEVQREDKAMAFEIVTDTMPDFTQRAP